VSDQDAGSGAFHRRPCRPTRFTSNNGFHRNPGPYVDPERRTIPRVAHSLP
jgi:hypothetical protein